MRNFSANQTDTKSLSQLIEFKDIAMSFRSWNFKKKCYKNSKKKPVLGFFCVKLQDLVCLLLLKWNQVPRQVFPYQICKIVPNYLFKHLKITQFATFFAEFF